MNKIKRILYIFWKWIKQNIYNFIAAMILSLITAIATQYTIIKVLNNDIEQNTIIISENVNNINNLVNTFNSLNKTIKNNYGTLNARIDTIESAIDPEKKRRKLIAKIRDAINENTNTKIDIRSLNLIANSVIDYSYLYNLTIPQILAQIRIESNFNPKAISDAGAQGLMQLMPDTLRLIQYDMRNGPSRLNVWNIHHNIRSGCFYMSQQITRFGSYEEALKAYNWGPHNLARYNSGERKDIPDETIEYVPKTKEFIEIFKRYGLE